MHKKMSLSWDEDHLVVLQLFYISKTLRACYFILKKHTSFGHLLSQKQSQTRQVKSMQPNTGLLHDAIVKTKT